MSTAYGLTLAGGIITLIGGVIGSLVGAILTFFLAGVGVLIGLWGIIVGVLLITSAMKLKTKDAHTWSIIGLIFSILGLITLQGFVIGPILALVGSAIGLTEKPKGRRKRRK